MTKVTIYTDGACRGNPGPGGYGAILAVCTADGCEHRKELSAGYRLTTNNRMEILAAVVALEALKRPCEVELFSDSKYLVDAFQQKWVEKWQRFDWYRDAKRKEKAKNVDLWQRLLAAMEPHKVTLHWVKGHAENPDNNRCDELAVAAALDQEHWLEDPEYAGRQET